MDLKTKLQNELVEAERLLKLAGENSEYNECIFAAEKYVLDCWLRLLAESLKKEFGIHVDDLIARLK